MVWILQRAGQVCDLSFREGCLFVAIMTISGAEESEGLRRGLLGIGSKSVVCFCFCDSVGPQTRAPFSGPRIFR